MRWLSPRWRGWKKYSQPLDLEENLIEPERIIILIRYRLSDNDFNEGYLDRNIQRQATTFSLGFVIVLYYRFFLIWQKGELFINTLL